MTHPANDQSQPVQHKAPEHRTGQLTKWAGGLGAITTVLGVYGYFVMLGIGDALHLDGGNLAGTTADVLHFAALGLITFLSKMPEFFTVKLFKSLFLNWNLAFMGFAMMLLAWVMLATERSPEAYAMRRSALKNHRYMQWFFRKWKGLAVYQWFIICIAPFSVPIVVAGVGFIFIWIMFWVVMFAWLGMHNGLGYVDSFQLQQAQCSAAVTVHDKNHPSVNCVQVRWVADGKELTERGFLITSTSNYVLLYDPTTRQGKRVPLSGQAILESVESLH
jgi:hypothetical protein